MANLEHKAIDKALRKFGKKVVIRAASLLSIKKRGYDTGKLSKSLDCDLSVAANSISVKFKMEDYGLAMNEGRGSSGSGSGALYPKILEWVKRKNLRPRNSKGQFESWRNKASQQRGIAFAVTRKIHRFGYKGTGFFNQAFEENYKKLPKNLKTAFALDLQTFLDHTIDEINLENGNNSN
tara:strand:- start:4017 stop:4556 length:540 start_codon:yes stop_codon:yes gene_type:complete